MKKLIICPECGHMHKVEIGGQKTLSQIGVRAKKTTSNQFEYIITAPQELMESGEFFTIADEFLYTAIWGIGFGCVCTIISKMFFPEYSLDVLVIGCSTGVIIAWGLLLAETNTRLKSTLPRARKWLMEQKENWYIGVDQAKPDSDHTEVVLAVNVSDSDNNSKVSYFGRLPVDLKRFNEYVSKVVLGETLAINYWTGQGKLFTRKEYDQILILLKNGGLVSNQGSNKGNILTLAGQRVFKQHLKQYPPTEVMHGKK